MQMHHDIHEDWIEFFFKDSVPPRELYHEYILRRLKEEQSYD